MTTDSVLPDSRSASDSPTHRIGESPCLSVARTFFRILSSRSPKSVLAFRMADDHIAAAKIAQHRSGHFSSEGPVRFPMYILCAEADPGGGTQGVADRFEGRKGRRNDHVGIRRCRHSLAEVAE